MAGIIHITTKAGKTHHLYAPDVSTDAEINALTSDMEAKAAGTKHEIEKVAFIKIASDAKQVCRRCGSADIFDVQGYLSDASSEEEEHVTLASAYIDDQAPFHERLKRFRGLNGFTRPALGKTVGVSGTTIAAWEEGDTLFPDYNQLIKLSLAMNIPTSFLFPTEGYDGLSALDESKIPGKMSSKKKKKDVDKDKGILDVGIPSHVFDTSLDDDDDDNLPW